MYEIIADSISIRFGFRKVFSKVSFSLNTGDSLAVTGKNGSGKTTLLRALAGLAPLTKGKIKFKSGDKTLEKSETRRLLSYVGPELTLYDSLTAEENLRFFATMRGIRIGKEKIASILDNLQLTGRGNDFYGAYSSGMKQRLKYATALLNDPVFLLLDEPTSNLDEEGKELVRSIVERQKENGILIIATNESGEYDLAEKRLQLGG